MPEKTPTPPAASNDMSELEARLKFLELQEKEEAYRQRAEKKAIEMEHRKRNAQNMENRRKAQMRIQAACSHQMKNGETYLAGQRAHSGTLILICQKCQKTFKGHEVPPHLMPFGEFIGGPNITSTHFPEPSGV